MSSVSRLNRFIPTKEVVTDGTKKVVSYVIPNSNKNSKSPSTKARFYIYNRKLSMPNPDRIILY